MSKTDTVAPTTLPFPYFTIDELEERLIQYHEEVSPDKVPESRLDRIREHRKCRATSALVRCLLTGARAITPDRFICAMMRLFPEIDWEKGCETYRRSMACWVCLDEPATIVTALRENGIEGFLKDPTRIIHKWAFEPRPDTDECEHKEIVREIRLTEGLNAHVRVRSYTADPRLSDDQISGKVPWNVSAEWIEADLPEGTHRLILDMKCEKCNWTREVEAERA